MTGQIASLKKDNIGTFRMVYHQYHAKLFRYVYDRTRSEYLAQEVVQITFIRLWEKRHNLSDDFDIDIQLFRISKTVLIDELRKEQVRNKHNEISNIYTGDSYNDLRTEDRDDLRRVFAELENLPPIRKKVFKLSRVHGMSYKQIAEVMSISPKTVENHISRAIKQLRNSISIFIAMLLACSSTTGQQRLGAIRFIKQIDNIKTIKKS